MRRKLLALLGMVVVAGGLMGIGAASAHECTTDPETQVEECHDTPVVESWRPNYVPLFDLPDRDDPEQRAEAQRWRDKDSCNPNVPHCFWWDGGESANGSGAPMEQHIGFAATHCFLAEAQHDCSDHDASNGEGVHDAHGGAIYVDVCVAENPESHYCDDGATDTQAGVTIVDHLDCPMGCFDEYHVVRPLDTDYTIEQTEDSAAAIEGIANDPTEQACGYEEHSVCP